jgi:ABC-type branched-subunit amino acid transport system ATPase component/ABC-type branched-subunit amino acid transport system permease subunit
MSAAELTAVATERASSILADLRDFRRRLSPHPELYAESARFLPVLGIAAIAFVGVFPLFGANDWILKLEEGLYFGLLALSLNILVGSAGMISFGQAMFLGIGAYTIAIPFRDHNINPLYLLALTPIAGALAAFLSGFIVLRGRALYFSLLTLGVAQLFWAVAHGWQSFTGGTNGISGIVAPGWFNAYADLGKHLYWFIFGCTLFCTILVYVIVKSPFGDALRAIRDNPRRAEFSGMWVKRYEMTAYVIAGTFGAVAGGLWILSDEGLTSDTLDWTKSAIVLVAVLIGGTRYFLGPFVGAIFWIYFFDEVHQATGKPGLLWDSILGAIVVFVALLAPGGVVGAIHTALAYALGLLRKVTRRPVAQVAASAAAEDQEAVHLPDVVPLPVPTKQAVNGRPVVLEVQHLSKRFGGLVAVNDVSIAVRQGSIHAIIGPNGAGKSTLFNLITGLHKPDSGRVLLGEHDVTGKPAWQLVKRGVGRSFQQTNLFWSLPSMMNVKVAGSAVHGDALKPFGRHSKRVTVRGQELLKRVGLQTFADAAANELSHGDQRSLEIATALAVEAKVLLLDEPTAGLAQTDTENAVELISRIAHEEDLTVLFVEHDMEVVFGIANYITVLNKGKVLAEGTPAEIKGNEAVREAYLGGEELTHVEEERGS